MPETEEQHKPKDLVELIKEYISTRIELMRLTAIERVTVVGSSLITDTFVVVLVVLTLLFTFLTLALYLGELLNSYAAGFGIVSLLFLVLSIVLIMIKDKIVERYLHDFMVKRIFKKKK
jgi:hypothetical protein